MAIPVEIINGGNTICSIGNCELTTIQQTSLIPAFGMIIILIMLTITVLILLKNGSTKNNSYSFDN